MKRTDRIPAQKPLYALREALEAQFDRIDGDLAHVRPRQINEYNQIVWMTKLLKGAAQ